MRFGKGVAFICAVATVGVAARADLAWWVQHQPAGALLDVLLRSMPMPGGAVRLRRPPSETRPALAKLIGATPKNVELYRLRAQEDEMQLDFAAAEADWREYATMASDRGAGYLALADFYHRRVRAKEEVQSLETVGGLPSDQFLPAPEQRSWQAYERMLPVIQEAGLPASATATVFRGWISRYPKEETPRREYIDFLVGQEEYAEADAQIGEYAKAFPDDNVFPVEARANLAGSRDSGEAAIKVYDQAFQPLWPKELLDKYFELLNQNGELRDFLGRARTAHDTGRLFAYFQHANNLAAARRVLVEYRLAKEAKPGSWTPAELRMMAGLFARLPDGNEEARAWYALYSIPNSAAADREAALAGIVALLLEKPDQPIRFGAGDLSLYSDIGTIDSSPGFLNGILSLILNSTTPRWQYDEQNKRSAAYFHRTAGAQLLELFEKQFPASSRRAPLRASLVDAYASYGDDEGVISAGRLFLTTFTRAAERTHVALTLADALARGNRTQEEFAVYQQMLTELAARAGGVPLGVHWGRERPTGEVTDGPQEQRAQVPGARSSDYDLVLNQYLARIAASNKPMDALRVYRGEIQRNPNDPGLYERFAGFLEQNHLGADVQDIYRRAIAKFPDKSWYHKLARWYLREKQQTEYTALSREVTGIFSGTELEAYFNDVVAGGEYGAALNVQLNQYAHQRFPEDLVFVRHLLAAYGATDTRDAKAESALLHDYWYYAADIKRQYFEQLSENGQLLNQMAVARRNPSAAANPAAAQLNAEAEAWLGHYEAAAAGIRAVADLYPGSMERAERAASIYRSLAYYFPADTAVAANLEQRAYDANPRDTKLLETVGDIYSDKDQFGRAAVAWNKIPSIFPGKPDGYLEAATVQWDYYRFDEALRLIGEARRKFDDPALYAYEAGAIEEGRRDYPRAVAEYLTGNETARERIMALASRPAQRDLIYRMTANADSRLRIVVLKAQQRRPELQAYLAKEIAIATQVSDLTPLIDAAREQGFDVEERQGLEREIAVTQDPVERMRLRIELVKHFEARKDLDSATIAMDGLYRDNPLILGVVRARVDFDHRNNRDSDAVAALLDAAAKARPELAVDFKFEAARIATTSGKIEQARALLNELIAKDPYNASYQAQMGETYAAAKDDAGFVRFASSEIDALKKSGLAPMDKKDRIASLRRRLIVTLTHENDFAAALDQYIEIINQYPEDETIVREAALFASSHKRQDQLTGFYRKTIANSPRDWRWPIVLARIDTTLEDYPAALGAYDNAMKSRPDRADLVQARAELEERLLRFDDAIKSYSRLYGLTYNDPQWLDKAAEFQARLGRGKEAVSTLERAHIGAGGETANGLFEIAQKLEEWHLISDAAHYADRGFKLAGTDVWTKYPSQVESYSKIMAEARQTDAVLELVRLDGTIASRASGVHEAGARIAELYTPEEKAALEAKLNAGPVGPEVVARQFDQSAGLEEHLAKLVHSSTGEWVGVESRRGRYEEISRELEKSGETSSVLAAAHAAMEAGDTETEMRIYARLQATNQLPNGNWNRYFSLLLARDPKSLVTLAGGSGTIADHAVQFAISNGSEALAMDAVRERSTHSLPPVWRTAYTALTGVYFDDRSPVEPQAFVATLNPQTIGQRVGHKPDATRALVGSVWYYYGARFGEYLTRTKSASAGDYIASELEESPGNTQAYLALGKFYLSAKEPSKAIDEFRKALDLEDLGEAHNDIALALVQLGRRDAAIAEWHAAFASFEREQGQGVRVRETFWGAVSLTIRDAAGAKAFASVQRDIHHLLADYVHRNGAYRIYELINPTLESSIKAKAGFEWLLDVLLQAGAEEISIPGMSADDEERLARFRMDYFEKKAAGANGYEKTNSQQQAVEQRVILINLLLRHGKSADALSEWKQFTPSELAANRQVVMEMRLAGVSGTMETLLARYRASPETAPAMNDVLSGSMLLREDGHVPAALSLLEFGYRRELDAQNLLIANFLGLGRVYLERGDSLESTMALLRRMTLVAGVPFEGFEPAADLLLEFHHDAEAREFLGKAVQATPWNGRAKLKLAQISAGADRTRLATEVANDSTAAYRERAEAALLLAPSALAGGGELALLASGNKSESAANRPFFVESRLLVGSLSALREALAIAPGDERVRIAAVRSALDGGKESLALAMYEAQQGQGVDGGKNRVLLERLSQAAERTGNLTGAINFLQEARRGTLAAADKDRIEARLNALQAKQKLQQTNVSRQPVIGVKLQQPHTVRAKETE